MIVMFIMIDQVIHLSEEKMHQNISDVPSYLYEIFLILLNLLQIALYLYETLVCSFL